jgi:hypothetical protein
MTRPQSALTPSQQKQRRAEAQAARSRPCCSDEQHTWVQVDTFGLASGERVTTWQCSTCRSTSFQYRDRTDHEQETAP